MEKKIIQRIKKTGSFVSLTAVLCAVSLFNSCFTSGGGDSTGGTGGTAGGSVKWAWAPACVSGQSTNFKAVAADSLGNTCAAGTIVFPDSSDTVDLGNGVTVKRPYADDCPVVAMFDADGKAKWAKTLAAKPVGSTYPKCEFLSVAMDNLGNVYVAGIVNLNYQYDFGDEVKVSGVYTKGSSARNAILVKYNNHGQAQWAKAAVTAPDQSEFWTIAVDTTGNVYAAGNISGNGTFNFGNSQTVKAGTTASITCNGVIVKYNAGTGDTQWARTVDKSLETYPISTYKSLATDISGNIFASGYISGTGTYTFGSHEVKAPSSSNNCLLVKYDISGTVQWARTLTAAADGARSEFNAVAVDSYGNACVAGFVCGAEADRTITFETGVTVETSADNYQWIVVCKYDISGTPKWARTMVSGNQNSCLYGIDVDRDGNVFVSGMFEWDVTFDLGNGVGVTGTVFQNPLIARYKNDGTPVWAKSPSLESYGAYNGIAADDNGYVYAAGEFGYKGKNDFGGAVLVGPDSVPGALMVKYKK